MLAQTLFPRLDGLLALLQDPTATFLDVGTGVATIAIQMCRLFPRLHAVGLEPQDAPLAQARRNVVEARLGDRIELRAQRIEDLTDREAFDLVWLPQVFLPREVLERGRPCAPAAGSCSWRSVPREWSWMRLSSVSPMSGWAATRCIRSR